MGIIKIMFCLLFTCTIAGIASGVVYRPNPLKEYYQKYSRYGYSYFEPSPWFKNQKTKVLNGFPKYLTKLHPSVYNRFQPALWKGTGVLEDVYAEKDFESDLKPNTYLQKDLYNSSMPMDDEFAASTNKENYRKSTSVDKLPIIKQKSSTLFSSVDRKLQVSKKNLKYSDLGEENPTEISSIKLSENPTTGKSSIELSIKEDNLSIANSSQQVRDEISTTGYKIQSAELSVNSKNITKEEESRNTKTSKSTVPNVVSSESKDINDLSKVKIPPIAKLTGSTTQSEESSVNITESNKVEILAKVYSTNSPRKEILPNAKSTESITSKADSSIHSTESSKRRIISSIYSTKPSVKQIALSTYPTAFSVPDKTTSKYSSGSSEQEIALRTYSTKPSVSAIDSNIHSTGSSVAKTVSSTYSTVPLVKEVLPRIYSPESSVNEIFSSTYPTAFSVPDKAINIYLNESSAQERASSTYSTASSEHYKESIIHSTEPSAQLITVNSKSTEQANEEESFAAKLIKPTKYQIPSKMESNRQAKIDISSSEKPTKEGIEESRDETREKKPLYIKPILRKLTTKYLAFTKGVDPIISLKPILHQIKHPLNKEYSLASFGIVEENGSGIDEDEEREVRKTLIKIPGFYSTENILLGIFLMTGCVIVLASGMYMIAMKRRTIQYDELRLLP